MRRRDRRDQGWPPRDGIAAATVLSRGLLEDDGATAVPQHAVLGVPAHRAGEGNPLGVPANRREVLRAAGVIHPGDFLLDDRALVKVRGDVVRGRAVS